MSTNQPITSLELDKSIDLFDLLIQFIVEWRIFLAASFLIFVLGVGAIFSITPLFEADASLLPQNKEDSSNLASFFSGRSPGDIFLGLLASRSVADEVIDRAGLMTLYKVKSREDARAILGARSVFAVGRDTLVTVKVRDTSAEAAMRITNAYLEGLESQRDKMLQRESEVHNRFFQQQLAREADALADAEQELKVLQEKTGLVQPEAQTSIGLNAIAAVRTQETNLQVQLAALLLSDSDQNPQVRALRAQIAQLQGQEHSLESAAANSGAGAAASAHQMPQLNLDYNRKSREVRYHEALFNSISSQYENARLSEGYTGAPFVVIDRAVAPEHKAWPPRRTLLMLVAAAGVVFGIFAVSMLLLWRKLRSEPTHRERIATVKNSFRLSR